TNNLTYTAGIHTLKGAISQCGFGVNTSEPLASAFVYYNWATLQEKRISLLDPNESDVGFSFKNSIKTFAKNKWTAGHLDLIAGTTFVKILPYGAVSFRIDADALSSTQKPYPMQLNIQTDKPLTLVSVKLNSNNTSTLLGAANNFNFTTQAGINKEHNLTDDERKGGLFITLANTSASTVTVNDINLSAKRFTRDDNTNIVTDHERGLQWQDETYTWLDSWYGAKRHCAALTLGGYDDWRVPTYIDLIYILDLAGPPYIYKEFEHLGAVGYWSLDLNGGVFPESESAKVINFGLGRWIWINTSYHMNTRCTRDYQVSTSSVSSKQSNKINTIRVIKEGNYEDFYQDNNNDRGGEYIRY
ncbi:MAG: DUF1566 domain-containing protein, partial [Sulfurovum sp.]|nr:DUF1566 domain-containing protein [Sulfurovum sp.]